MLWRGLVILPLRDAKRGPIKKFAPLPCQNLGSTQILQFHFAGTPAATSAEIMGKIYAHFGEKIFHNSTFLELHKNDLCETFIFGVP